MFSFWQVESQPYWPRLLAPYPSNEVHLMATTTAQPQNTFLRLQMGEFWSGDIGLTLVTISLVLLVFVITPLREAALSGRAVLELIIVALMVCGTVTVKQGRLAAISVVGFISLTAIILGVARLHPSAFLHQVGSVLATITLLLYVRVVLLVMFRAGRITWSRIQGGVCAYLLLGMAWASAFQVLEQYRPGSFRFVGPPLNFDQLISKLTYYSFCTLTTLGSEVSPVSPIARSLTIAEALVGQLFPAVFIGALVAMAMQSQSKVS